MGVLGALDFVLAQAFPQISGYPDVEFRVIRFAREDVQHLSQMTDERHGR